MQLRKEAEFFGDIIVVPYMDSYDLVVLKTVAICEYGVSFYSKNQRVNNFDVISSMILGKQKKSCSFILV